MRDISTFPIRLAVLMTLLLLISACCPACTSLQTAPVQGAAQARVTRIVDGDTIVVKVQGRDYKVRYIGMDTPETTDPRRPAQYFGKEAADKNRELVEGKMVILEKDVSEMDRYGRLLRYVWVEGVMVNAEMVRLGYARSYTYPPDVKYQDVFATLEKEARENKRGLWAENPVK
jgi:micrococcal nuclease